VLIKSFENPNLAARYTRLFLHERLWLFSSSTARTEYGSVDAVEVRAARYPGAAWSTRSWRPFGSRRDRICRTAFEFGVVGEVTIADDPELAARLKHVITRFGKHLPGRGITDGVVFVERRIVEHPVDAAPGQRGAVCHVEHPVSQPGIEPFVRGRGLLGMWPRRRPRPVRLVDERASGLLNAVLIPGQQPVAALQAASSG
jgi:hypothetical protein